MTAKPKPLFISGLVCSGTTILCRLLCGHPEITVASDPYFILFRSLRNALLARSSNKEIITSFDPASPIDDYYFKEAGIQMLDAIQESTLDIQFDNSEWNELYKRSVDRARHESADLVPHLTKLQAATYKEMIQNGLDIIADVRGARDRTWVGFKEVWTIEFFKPLARAFEDARFIVIMRDPRGVVASNDASAAKAPEQVAHPLSVARHWRKYAAFLHHYKQDPLLKNRLHVLTLDQLVLEPERTIRELSDFLDVRQEAWFKNGDDGNKALKFDRERVLGWKTKIRPEVHKMVDLVCGPDMELFGYKQTTDAARLWPEAGVFDYIIKRGREYSCWRSDFNDPQRDCGFELFRRALLYALEALSDPGLVRRSFLFEDAFREIRKHAASTNSFC